jgi:hypothetical protein
MSRGEKVWEIKSGWLFFLVFVKIKSFPAEEDAWKI